MGNPGTDDAHWKTSDELLTVVYDALRRLASYRMRSEPSGHTLQPTALVHEVYLRLLRGDDAWNGEAHFFGAATQAMRRILVERARRYRRMKHGSGLARVSLDEIDLVAIQFEPDLLLLDDALDRLALLDGRKAEIVHLRFFGGFTIAETARILEISPATVKLDWSYARAWLRKTISESRSLGN